ncbi:hypothetical protein YQE_05584, partial [Dendroctonus ponderosae]
MTISCVLGPSLQQIQKWIQRIRRKKGDAIAKNDLTRAQLAATTLAAVLPIVVQAVRNPRAVPVQLHRHAQAVLVQIHPALQVIMTELDQNGGLVLRN